jgi:hypothetical protein
MALKKSITQTKTKVMLKIYIEFWAAIYDGTLELSSADLFSIPLTKIGGVMKIGYTNDRGKSKHYRLLGEDGKIHEKYPSLGDYDLKFDTIVYYNSDLFSQFGWDSGDIMFQDSPILGQFVIKRPSKAPKVFTFSDIWFENNKLEWDSEADDLKMTKEVNASGILISSSGIGE